MTLHLLCVGSYDSLNKLQLIEFKENIVVLNILKIVLSWKLSPLASVLPTKDETVKTTQNTYIMTI